MDYTVIAVIAAVVNLSLSILIPCIFKKINFPKSSLFSEIKKMIRDNREILLISSLLAGVFVFLSLESSKTPFTTNSNNFNNDMLELSRLFNLGNINIPTRDF